VSHPDRRTDLLFHRLDAMRPGPRDANQDADAARAADAWPLLSLLTPPAQRSQPSVENKVDIPDIPPPPEPSRPSGKLEQLFARLDREAARMTPTPAAAPPVRRVASLAPTGDEVAHLRPFENIARN
jgi:hypothetical protein